MLQLIFRPIVSIALWFVGTNLASAEDAASQTYAPWTGPYADEIPYPTPDDVWLTMGWSNKQTSSKCIGKGTTPLCAVETYFACQIRGVGSLCAQASGEAIVPGSEKPIPGYTPYPRTGLMRYQLLSVTRVTEALAAEVLAQDPASPERTGDIVMNFMWEMCGRADAQGRLSDCCHPEYAESTFLLRRLQDRWIVVEANHPLYVQKRYVYWSPRPEDERSSGGPLFTGPRCETIRARTNDDTY